MKRGFYTIMSAQFFSSLADNALFVAAVELMRTSGAPEWQRAALVPIFTLFYVAMAPLVGAFADAFPKGKVMFASNAIKVAGCLMMLFGSHPLLAYAVVGLGAAAVGAVAGAALFARNKARASDEFELRLQTDEGVRLISSSKVEGTPVVGRSGEHLGKIENFMVDKYSGRVAYAVMSFGGTLGFGDQLFPLPWSYLTYDTAKDGYVLDITKEQLAEAPKFKASEAPEFNTGYRQDVARFYGRSGA